MSEGEFTRDLELSMLKWGLGGKTADSLGQKLALAAGEVLHEDC
jgi:hypothetical protein